MTCAIDRVSALNRYSVNHILIKHVTHEFKVFKIHLRAKIGYFYYPVIFDYPAVFSKTRAQHDRIIEEVLYFHCVVFVIDTVTMRKQRAKLMTAVEALQKILESDSDTDS